MARYDLDALRLDGPGKRLDENLIASVTETGWERTIEGASTLTFILDDPLGDVIESQLLTEWAWGDGDLNEDQWILAGRKIDVRIGDEVYRLVKVIPQGSQLTLTLEDRDVARLREQYGARKMRRDDVTRAEFGRRLIAEVKHPSIPAYVPELHVVQPIAKPKATKPTASDRLESASSGIDPSTPDLTVKGQKATARQIKVAEALLDAAYSYKNVPQLAVVALLCAATHESVMGTLGMTPETMSDGDSVGVLQARTSYVSVRDAESIPYNVKRFMVEPWTGTSFGGAIKQARAGRSLDDITTSIQGNSTGSVYSQWRDEALKWIAAYGGSASGGRADESQTITRTKHYQFERKPRENTWDCLGRLFDEVNWRRFMRKGRVWLASEEVLFAQRPVAHLAPGRKGVDTIDFELDMFSRDQLHQATVTARAGTHQVQPGQLVVVQRRGPGNGRWLVASVSGKFGDDAEQITLKKATRQKPEPAPSTESASGTGSGGTAAPGTPLAAVQAVYDRALAISKENLPYVWGGGHPNAGHPSGGGYDCSGYTAASLLEGGFLPDSWSSVPSSSSFESLGLAGEGKYMTVWANSEHVWIEFNLPGREGARADTSPHGSGGEGPHMRYTRRSTDGFVARHFAGT